MDIVERLRKRVIPVQYGEFKDALEDKDCQEAANEIERLREALKIAVDMRNAQKAYFKDRNQQNLIISKQAEKAFDTAFQQKDSE